MSMLSPVQLNEFIDFAERADRETREDLRKQLIASENDYTSAFVTRLRDLVRLKSGTGLTATSLKLGGSDEQEIGADAAIILNSDGLSKVAVFEAKWPRFKRTLYKWDNTPKGASESRFSSQISRQAKWVPRVAVFEMFYAEHSSSDTPNFLQSEGSTCVWYDDARRFGVNRGNPIGEWTQGDLRKLLSRKGKSLVQILRDFGECRKGEAMSAVKPEQLASQLQLPPRVLVVDAGRCESPTLVEDALQRTVPLETHIDDGPDEDAPLECFVEQTRGVPAHTQGL